MHRVFYSTLGEKGVGETTVSPLYYRGTRFHSIKKGLMAQVLCYFTSNCNALSTFIANPYS
ncbi:hypothetical protein HU200_042606 [Digitaria exilis]|uniref:Uncharacterized protein n=1 Tax=Digitaria exilis TaxID=1010633 RepID=A0A835B4H9_9POAL|nr:hypothetical protein HU200_042606 [Digitaria exilis]